MRVHKKRRSGVRGAAAVEFAIVLPLFLTLVLGTIDYGYYFFVSEVVTNAAREGARAGSVVDPSDQALAVSEAESVANNYLARGGLSQQGVQTPTIVQVNGVDAVRVEINYPVGSLTGFFPSTMIPAISHALAVMRWQ
jgi:Flp pilus assembly protein TadG